MPRLAPNTHLRPIPACATGSEPGRIAIATPIGDSSARAQLERIVRSQIFAGAHRSKHFLRYIVEHALTHPDEPLKEYSIALDVFNRGAYDPAINNTVRVEAARLRSRLLEYYASVGHADPLLIEVPRGSYRAVIRARQPVLVPGMRPTALAPVTSTSSASAASRPRYPWAVPIAFALGAFLGYRVSR